MDKNIKLNINGGGPFSLYMLGIQNMKNIIHDNFYFNIINDNVINHVNFVKNPFDYVINQKLNDTYKTINNDYYPVYSNGGKCIENSKSIELYKNIVKKIDYNERLLRVVNHYVNENGINGKTLGVHIRLTDMSVYHPEYGIRNFNSYKNCIDDLLKSNEYDNIFIASDNNESLKKMKNIYGEKVCFINDLMRVEKENGDLFKLTINNFVNEIYWFEAFLEMLLLSKCGELIGGVSNLLNASYINSDTIKKINRV